MPQSVLLLLVCSGALMALDSNSELSQFRHEVWLTENGLPQNTVHALAQTSDGYLWIGTEEGLARFDGVRFTVFNKKNTAQLKSNYIRALLADRRGALWIGTAEGLVRLFEGRFTAFTTNEGLPSNTIQAVYEDREGNLWVATATGLGLFKQRHLNNLHDQGKANWRQHSGIIRRYRRRALDCTPYGLGRLKDGKFTNYTVRDGLGSNSVRSIQQDRDGRLWFGTLSGLSRSMAAASPPIQPEMDCQATESWHSRRTRRAICLWGPPVVSVDSGTASSPGSMPAMGWRTNTILSLLEDREGNLWIGTESGWRQSIKGHKVHKLYNQERTFKLIS